MFYMRILNQFSLSGMTFLVHLRIPCVFFHGSIHLAAWCHPKFTKCNQKSSSLDLKTWLCIMCSLPHLYNISSSFPRQSSHWSLCELGDTTPTLDISFSELSLFVEPHFFKNGICTCERPFLKVKQMRGAHLIWVARWEHLIHLW